MEQYRYWVFKVLFFVCCQLAASIGAILTLHDAEFEVSINEIGRS